MSSLFKGMLRQSIDDNKKYRIYFTSSLERIVNGQFIAAADSYQEVIQKIKEQPAVAEFNSYWRFLLGEEYTFIDYGSWSRFIAIDPAIPREEIC